MSEADSPHVAKKIIPHNELASLEPKMTFEQLIKALSDVQDELYARNMSEPAQLVHRALNRVTTCTMNGTVTKRMELKKKDEAI